MKMVEIVVSPRYFSIYTGTDIQYSLVDKGTKWTTSSTVEFNHYYLHLLIFYVGLNHVYYFK